MKYNPNIVRTVANTIGLDAISVKPLKAASKSIGFGATRNPPPKFVKWVQRQTVVSKVVSEVTLCKYRKGTRKISRREISSFYTCELPLLFNFWISRTSEERASKETFVGVG